MLNSQSLIRADTERVEMFEKAAENSSMLLNKVKRDAVVKVKPTDIVEELEEVKSYDSEDSLDKLNIEVAPAPQLSSHYSFDSSRTHSEPASHEPKQPDFRSELLTKNIKEPIIEEKEPVKAKFDVFKLINKNEHLFIKYAENKLVENKLYIMERA